MQLFFYFPSITAVSPEKLTVHLIFCGIYRDIIKQGLQNIYAIAYTLRATSTATAYCSKSSLSQCLLQLISQYS